MTSEKITSAQWKEVQYPVLQCNYNALLTSNNIAKEKKQLQAELQIGKECYKPARLEEIIRKLKMQTGCLLDNQELKRRADNPLQIYSSEQRACTFTPDPK